MYICRYVRTCIIAVAKGFSRYSGTKKGSEDETLNDLTTGGYAFGNKPDLIGTALTLMV